MLRIDYAVMMVAGTLAIVAAVVAAYFAIRNRLSRDPDLQEFAQRVDDARAARVVADSEAEAGAPVGGPGLEGQPFPDEAGAQEEQECREATDDRAVDPVG